MTWNPNASEVRAGAEILAEAAGTRDWRFWSHTAEAMLQAAHKEADRKPVAVPVFEGAA